MPSIPPFGVYPPIVTFFHEDESTEKLVQHLVSVGVTSLVLQESNGEAPRLLHSERQEIIRRIRNVRETLIYISEAQAAGADYALVLPPAYFASAMAAIVHYHGYGSSVVIKPLGASTVSAFPEDIRGPIEEVIALEKQLLGGNA
ncbi:hypothetical protein V1523DRAFT_449512 [Lipomyces doorenjongii]